MKTIKIIDLLNTPLNELPKKIKVEDKNYTLFIDEDTNYHYYQDDECKYFMFSISCFDELNEEVEIIEDKKVECVEKIYDLTDFHKNYPEVAEMLRDLANKTIEIIDYINKNEEEK